jgi:hypothetical protein
MGIIPVVPGRPFIIVDGVAVGLDNYSYWPFPEGYGLQWIDDPYGVVITSELGIVPGSRYRTVRFRRPPTTIIRAGDYGSRYGRGYG